MNTTITIPGIHCQGCANLIKDVSGDFPAITSTHIDLDAKTVTLEHDEDFDLQQWSQEIESLDPTYKISSTSSA